MAGMMLGGLLASKLGAAAPLEAAIEASYVPPGMVGTSSLSAFSTMPTWVWLPSALGLTRLRYRTGASEIPVGDLLKAITMYGWFNRMTPGQLQNLLSNPLVLAMILAR